MRFKIFLKYIYLQFFIYRTYEIFIILNLCIYFTKNFKSLIKMKKSTYASNSFYFFVILTVSTAHLSFSLFVIAEIALKVWDDKTIKLHSFLT